MLVSQSIPALYGGVSRQAAVGRASNQVEEAINVHFSIAKGASKRPPLETMTPITDYAVGAGVDPGDILFAEVAHPSGARFVLMLPGDGTYSVYRLSDGAKISSDNDTAQAYLTLPVGVSPAEAFSVLSFGDRIYVVNQTVVTAEGGTTAGTLTGDAQTLQDNALDSATEGAIYRILGDAANPYDTYYAKKTSGKWVEWVRPGISYQLDATTMPHQVSIVEDEVDPLGFKADFNVGDWADKIVGDEKSNKSPSFVGRAVSGIFFAHDRLGLLSGSSITMSETGEYGNFYRTTVTDVLDTDRIDITVASEGGSTLYFAKPVGKSIVFFAPERQFSVDGSPIFSPRTVAATEATDFPSSSVCAPASAGPNVYFATSDTGSTMVMELFIQDDTVTKDAANVTAHVQGYIPGDVEQLETNNNHDYLFVRLKQDSGLYAYRSYWAGDQKVQSAWANWRLGKSDVTVNHVFADKEFLYVVYSFTHNSRHYVQLGRINLDIESGFWETFSGMADVVNLDFMMKINPEFNAGENRSYFTLPYPIWDSAWKADARLVFLSGANTGKMLKLDALGPTPVFAGSSEFQFYLMGDWSGTSFAVGLNYTKRLTLSEQFFNQGDRPVLTARLQLRNMVVAFQDTGYFKTEVKVLGHDPATNAVLPALSGTYTSRTLGSENFLLNGAQLGTGTYRFPVLGKSSEVSISLINDEFTPSHFISAEWEGLLSTRTRR